MKNFFLCFFLFFVSTAICSAALVDDLIQLKGLGLDEDTLVKSAQQSDTKLEPADLIKLLQAGFSSDLIKKLLASPETPKTVTEQPQTIIIQQGPSAPAGQIEITVHTHAKGGRFYIDGELVTTLHHGINKVTAPSGEHELRLNHAEHEYKKVVNLDPGKPNVFYIFYFDTSNENSKVIASSYKKKFEREITDLERNNFSETLTSDRSIVGRVFYENINCSVHYTIRIFSDEYTRMAFCGTRVKEIYRDQGNKIYKDDSQTIFFTIDLDSDLKEISSYYNFEKARDFYSSRIFAYRSFDENIAKISAYNQEEHQPNFKVVFSDEAKKGSKSFGLRIDMSDILYDFQIQDSSGSICPLTHSYLYRWERSGLDKSERVMIKDDMHTIVAVHSNWLGNQTKIYHIPKDVDLNKVTFDNVKSF